MCSFFCGAGKIHFLADSQEGQSTVIQHGRFLSWGDSFGGDVVFLKIPRPRLKKIIRYPYYKIMNHNFT